MSSDWPHRCGLPTHLGRSPGFEEPGPPGNAAPGEIGNFHPSVWERARRSMTLADRTGSDSRSSWKAGTGMTLSRQSHRQAVIENTRVTRRYLLLGAASATGLALVGRSVKADDEPIVITQTHLDHQAPAIPAQGSEPLAL